MFSDKDTTASFFAFKSGDAVHSIDNIKAKTAVGQIYNTFCTENISVLSLHQLFENKKQLHGIGKRNIMDTESFQIRLLILWTMNHISMVICGKKHVPPGRI